MTVSIMWLILTVRCIGLRYMIAGFPDHTHLLFELYLVGNPEHRVSPDEAQMILGKPHFPKQFLNDNQLL